MFTVYSICRKSKQNNKKRKAENNRYKCISPGGWREEKLYLCHKVYVAL
jgi:hypothetical protein